MPESQPYQFEKDCDCITHEGPHWIHMNNITKRLNYQRMQQQIDNHGGIVTPLMTHWFSIEEGIRLRDLLWHMERKKVDQLPLELVEEIPKLRFREV